MQTNHFARILSWLCIVAIIVLSLLPGSLRPHLFENGSIEHVLAYAGTGFLLAISYHALHTRLLFLVGLGVLSCLFEIAQIWIPDRHPQVIDAVASTAGAAIGLLVGAAAVSILKRGEGTRAKVYVR